MNKVNYHVLNDSIIVSFDGITHVIAKGDGRYTKVLDAIKAGQLDLVPDLVDLTRALKAQGLDVIEGLIHIEGQAMPDSLSKRILSMNEQDIPFDYLLKFWDNLKQNPSFNARKMMFDFLEHNGHPLTTDGCFIAYRGCTEDFKDRHTGKFDNSVGAVCQMDRNLVDDNPNNTCSTGLHVASHDYAYNWAERTVEVKVNPADVVCVPTDYNGTKMRVCKFEVVALNNEKPIDDNVRPIYDYDDGEVFVASYDDENWG